MIFENTFYEMERTEEVEEIIDYYGVEALEIYLQNYYSGGNFDSSDFEYRYLGQFDTIRDYAEFHLECSEILRDANPSLIKYFDYNAYIQDLQLSGCFLEEKGHYFWNN